MQRAGVIRLVHADCRRVVVDRDVHWAPEAHLDAGAGTAAAGEQVDVDFFVLFSEWQAVLSTKAKSTGLDICRHG